MLRAIIFTLALSLPKPAFADALTFVAIATGKTEKQAAYEKFLSNVQPIWKRHGMRLVIRASIDERTNTGFTDIALIEAGSRESFKAYLSDPNYQALAPTRLEAVDTLVVLEGPRAILPPKPAKGTALNILFQRECEAKTPGARVSLVGRVKGSAHPLYFKTGCVRFLTADDAPATGVLAGFSAHTR